jgi:hypothetical protein
MRATIYGALSGAACAGAARLLLEGWKALLFCVLMLFAMNCVVSGRKD